MTAIDETRQWIERIVIGLNLCPFARSVYEAKSIRFHECHWEGIDNLLEGLISECDLLDRRTEITTTLLIYPQALDDFYDYLDVVAAAENWMREKGYEGVYQIASFHPAYVFDGCELEDPANHSNRAPYPTLHIIREEELSEALANYANPERIPARNVRVLRKLGHQGLRDILLAKTKPTPL